MWWLRSPGNNQNNAANVNNDGNVNRNGNNVNNDNDAIRPDLNRPSGLQRQPGGRRPRPRFKGTLFRSEGFATLRKNTCCP